MRHTRTYLALSKMKSIVGILCIIFGFSAADDDFPKCSIRDSECQRDSFQKLASLAEHEIPELGVPVLDPFQLNDITVPYWNVANLTLKQGQAEGIRNCNLTSYKTDVENRRKMPEMICDMVITGTYEFIPSQIVPQSQRDTLKADGNLTITMNGWSFKIDYPFKIVKRSDDKIYLKPLFDEATYKAKVENVTIQVDGVIFNGEDASDRASNWLNEYANLIMHTNTGKTINDKSVMFYYEEYTKLFENTPVTTFYTDDFEPLVDETID